MLFLNFERRKKIYNSCLLIKHKFYARYKELFPQKHSFVHLFVAFIVAVFLWINVESKENIDRNYIINISYRNIPSTMELVEFPREFEIYVQADEDELSDFEKIYNTRVIRYELDLSELNLGPNVFEIELDVLEDLSHRRAFEQLDILAINPSHIVIIAKEKKVDDLAL